LCETVGCIPVRIGVQDLKFMGVTSIAHRFMRWTKGIPLTVEDVELRTVQWEELLPKGDGAKDIDAVSAKFYKTVRGKKRFDPKLHEMVLALPYDKYDLALINSLREDVDVLDTLKVMS
jgi:hypothetical protein